MPHGGKLLWLLFSHNVVSFKASAVSPTDELAAFAEDDECQSQFKGEQCAVSALQLQGRRTSKQVPLPGPLAEAAGGELWTQFHRFMVERGRSYRGSEIEERFARFKETLERTQALNAKAETDIFGLNANADLYDHERPAKGLVINHEQMRDRLRSMLVAPSSLGAVPYAPVGDDDGTGLPKVINWRNTKVITPVKNQGVCGACWAFSAVETIESMYVLWQRGGEEGFPSVFSVQQLASCVQDADGCGGGNPIQAFDFLVRQRVPLTQEAYWPYSGGFMPEETCNDKQCTKPCTGHDLRVARSHARLIGPFAVVKDSLFATPMCDPDAGPCINQNLDALAQSLVTLGPIAIAVNAKRWYDYVKGVMSFDACGGANFGDLDHAAQLVGYNRTGGTPYWLVRNQWSDDWGEHGYIRLEYGKNTCGLANLATVPYMEGMPPIVEDVTEESSLLEKAKRPNEFQRLYRQATGQAPSDV